MFTARYGLGLQIKRPALRIWRVKVKNWYLTPQFRAMKNCTVQLALLVYVASEMGLQHLEKFGTSQWKWRWVFLHWSLGAMCGALLVVNWKLVRKRRFLWRSPFYCLHIKWLFWNWCLTGGKGWGGAECHRCIFLIFRSYFFSRRQSTLEMSLYGSHHALGLTTVCAWSHAFVFTV